MSRAAVILAAGKGTRMKSDLPKVVVPVLGRPMIQILADVLDQAEITRQIYVVGYRQELVRQALSGRPAAEFVEQTEQLGTGHAVKVCGAALADYDGPVMVLAGDSPMITPQSINRLFEEFDRRRAACILGTAHKEDPTGLGRIVRDTTDRFVGIVEEKDATSDQKAIKEVNLSCYVFDSRALFAALAQVTANNAQKEYYLTDCPAILLKQGRGVFAVPCLSTEESLSINTMDELGIVEQALLARKKS